LEKGAITKASKIKSISDRWFNQKAKNKASDVGKGDLYIQHDGHLQLKFLYGGSTVTESIESYHLLACFQSI